MPTDPGVIDIGWTPHGGHDDSRHDVQRVSDTTSDWKPSQTAEVAGSTSSDWAGHMGRDDVEDRFKRQILAGAGVFQDFPPGDTVFAEGELGDRLYIVISGKIKISRRSPDGHEIVQTLLGPWDMFGELSLLDPGPRMSSATAITEVRAVSMDRDALQHWIVDRPEISAQLVRVLARRLRRANHDLADLVYTDVPGRVAKQLLRLARQFGTPEGGALRVTHNLTQQEIAQLVGASRETVNKALADFVHRGWIQLRGKSVLISDAERLAARARQ